MNNLQNTYIAKDVTTVDIDILIRSKDDINDGVLHILYLLKLNKLPLIDKLSKLVERKKIKLVVNEELKHANVRWVYDKGVVFVNVTKSAKVMRGVSEDKKWNIPSNELYSYILGAAVFLYSKKLNKDRTYLKSICDVYMELMGKIFSKASGGFFKGNNELSMFNYIMLRHLFENNNTAVINIDAYCEKISNIEASDLKVIQNKYDKKYYKDLKDVVNNILKAEFSFMDKLNITGLLHTLTMMIGPENAFMLENIDTIGALICDNVMGNRLSLYAKYPTLKSLFKSTQYNNILEVLKDA